MNLGERGEFGLIGMLSQWFRPNSRTLVGIGDDAAVLATPDGRVVSTVDFVLEGTHFTRSWAAAADVGHKAAARSLADLAAMGAAPTALLVALAAPADLPLSWLEDLARGLAAEAERAGAAVIGGDTARAEQIILAVTGLGDLEGRPPVLRSGARPGDIVAVCGPLGHAAAGLALLSAGAAVDPELQPLIAAQLRPSPPYEAGPQAAILGATAMIDVSDGLLADLGHIAEASDVLIDVSSAALADPLLDKAWIITRAPAPQAHPEPSTRWALTGGEDHALLATFPPTVPLPPPWHQIATVTATACPAPTRVFVDGRPWSTDPGWDHFRSHHHDH